MCQILRILLCNRNMYYNSVFPTGGLRFLFMCGHLHSPHANTELYFHSKSTLFFSLSSISFTRDEDVFHRSLLHCSLNHLLCLQVGESPQRAVAALMGARPNPQDQACQGGRDRPLCPQCTRRETATDELPLPTVCGKTGLHPQV